MIALVVLGLMTAFAQVPTTPLTYQSVVRNAQNQLVINQTGITVDFNDKEKMKSVILDLYKKYQENQLVTNDIKAVEKYSRRNLVKDFVKILNEIV